MASEIWNLPNVLTLIRILLIPVMVVFLTDPGPTASALAGLTFFIACVSDFLDGYFARRWNISTTLGKLLDPLADKLIVATALIMLVAMDRQPEVPAWMAVVIIGREIAVTGLRAVALNQGVVLAAEELGKYKAIFQMSAVEGLLLHYDFLGIDFHHGGLYFAWISIVIGLWSGIAYYIKVIRELFWPAPSAA
ncbi:MAG: CDP-diacylglycerol--glycerol-3-phosphate 3-phosphatidyltransferase [Deltaproteobacteria bacterium]|nr:CDP-diacylglycerol--glycerol-3-phosphate 3-phosphatidyltransferase [Deltaproteobacteria bacterium]